MNLSRKDYIMQLRVFEKFREGKPLTNREKAWKIDFNERRNEKVYTENGVKITRYKPNWSI